MISLRKFSKKFFHLFCVFERPSFEKKLNLNKMNQRNKIEMHENEIKFEKVLVNACKFCCE